MLTFTKNKKIIAGLKEVFLKDLHFYIIKNYEQKVEKQWSCKEKTAYIANLVLSQLKLQL